MIADHNLFKFECFTVFVSCIIIIIIIIIITIIIIIIIIIIVSSSSSSSSSSSITWFPDDLDNLWCNKTLYSHSALSRSVIQQLLGMAFLSFQQTVGRST